MNTLKITFEAADLKDNKINLISNFNAECDGMFLASVYEHIFDVLEKQCPKIFIAAMGRF